MNEILQTISKIGIVPVIAIEDASKAVPLAKALVEGGLPVAEITFRTAAAEESIRRVHEELPHVALCAGTVLTTEQVDQTIAAGGKFVVTPGLDIEIVKYCQEKGIEIYAGCTTPTDYHAAYKLGLEVLKFFPAEQSGGLAKIKAMSAPFPMFKVMPTGGISTKNLEEYLNCKAVFCCGGSWMVPGDLMDKGDFEGIEALAREAANMLKK